MSTHEIELTLNGRAVQVAVEARETLGDLLRGKLGLTGTHLACEHGVCGACTVMVDGDPVRSCLMLGVQADGCDVTTVEGLTPYGEELHPIQQAMREEFALQCGFCTPGIVMTLAAMTGGDAQPDEETLIDALGGHVCRCTGYQGIRRAARRIAASDGGESA